MKLKVNLYSKKVTSDSEFKSWIHDKAKERFKDSYSEEVTEKVANDLLEKYGTDYTAMTGAFIHGGRTKDTD